MVSIMIKVSTVCGGQRGRPPSPHSPSQPPCLVPLLRLSDPVPCWQNGWQRELNCNCVGFVLSPWAVGGGFVRGKIGDSRVHWGVCYTGECDEHATSIYMCVCVWVSTILGYFGVL